MADGIILLALAFAAAGILFFKIRKIRKKGFGCSCGCDGCGAAGCPGRKPREENKRS